MANDNVKLENLHKENTGKGEVSRIIQLSDNTCFDINELAHWVIGNGNRNPYAPDRKIWDERDELDRILNHPKLESDNKNELNKLFPDIDSDIIYETLMNHIDIFYMLGEVGLILLSDYKDEEFKDSSYALRYLGEKIDELNETDRQVFFSLKTRNGISLRKTLEDASGSCIHDGGFIIASIFSKYYLDAKTKMLQKNGKYIGTIHPGYCFVGDGTMPKSMSGRNDVLFGYLCPYQKNIIQICYYSDISIDPSKFGRILAGENDGEKITRFTLHNQIFGFTRQDCIILLGNIQTAYPNDLLLKDCFNYYLKVRNPPDEQLMSLIKKNNSFFDFKKIRDKHQISIQDYITYVGGEGIHESGFFIRYEQAIDVNKKEKCVIKVRDGENYQERIINISQITNILNGYRGLTFRELEDLYTSITVVNNENNNAVDIMLKDMVNNNLPNRNIEELVNRYFSEDIIRLLHVRRLDKAFTEEFNIIYKNYGILNEKIEEIKYDIDKSIYDKFKHYYNTIKSIINDDNSNIFFYIYDYYYDEYKTFLDKYKEKLNLLRIEVGMPESNIVIPEKSIHTIMISKEFISEFIDSFEMDKIILEHNKKDPDRRNIKIWKVLDKCNDELNTIIPAYYTKMHEDLKTEVFNKIKEFVDICLLLQNTKIFINVLKEHYGKEKIAVIENKLKNNMVVQKNNMVPPKLDKDIVDIMKFKKYDLLRIIYQKSGEYHSSEGVLIETRQSKIVPSITYYRYFLKDDPSKVKEVGSDDYTPILINRLSDNKREDVDRFEKKSAYNFIREYYDAQHLQIRDRINHVERIYLNDITKGIHFRRINNIYNDIYTPLKLEKGEMYIKLLRIEMEFYGRDLNNRDNNEIILKPKNNVKDISKLKKYDLIKLSDSSDHDIGLIVSKVDLIQNRVQILLWKGQSKGWEIETLNPENTKFLLRGFEPNKSNNKVQETILAELYREIINSDYDFEKNKWKRRSKGLIYEIEEDIHEKKSKKNKNNNYVNNKKSKKNSIPKINQVNLAKPKFEVHKLRKQFYKPMNEKTRKYFTLFRGDPQTSRKVLLLLSDEHLFKDFTTIIEKINDDFQIDNRLILNPRFLMRSKNIKHKGDNILKNNSKIFEEYYKELDNYNSDKKIFEKKNETMLYLDDIVGDWKGYLPGDLILEGDSILILGSKIGKHNPMYFNNHNILFNHVTNWMPFEYFDKGAGLSYSDFTINAFERCMESDKRYIIFILTIRIQSGGYHANAMIIDREDKTIVRFEPNGKGFKVYDHADLDYQFNQFIKGEYPSLTKKQSDSIKIIFKDIEYITPNMYQANRGPQAIESMLSGIKYIQGQTDGFCAAWSMYFIHLFLYNNSKEHRVSAQMICKFLENKDATKELGPNIRGYMAFLVEYIEKHRLVLPQIKPDGQGNNDWS